MGIRYNRKYKKGKYGKTLKATRADLAKTSKNITENRDLWLSDTRKYDFPGEDTRPLNHRTKFKYKYRSGKLFGKKPGRQNKTYRRYWY